MPCIFYEALLIIQLCGSGSRSCGLVEMCDSIHGQILIPPILMVVFPKLRYDTYGLWKELWTEIWMD